MSTDTTEESEAAASGTRGIPQALLQLKAAMGEQQSIDATYELWSACNSVDDAQMIVTGGGVALLARLLKSGPQKATAAATMLIRIADRMTDELHLPPFCSTSRRCIDFVRALRDSGASELLTQLCSRWEEEAYQPFACDVAELIGLMADKDDGCANEIHRSGAILPLVRMLGSDNGIISARAAEALSALLGAWKVTVGWLWPKTTLKNVWSLQKDRLVMGYMHSRLDAVVSSGGIGVLVSLLRSTRAAYVEAASLPIQYWDEDAGDEPPESNIALAQALGALCVLSALACMGSGTPIATSMLEAGVHAELLELLSATLSGAASAHGEFSAEFALACHHLLVALEFLARSPAGSEAIYAAGGVRRLIESANVYRRVSAQCEAILCVLHASCEAAVRAEVAASMRRFGSGHRRSLADGYRTLFRELRVSSLQHVCLTTAAAAEADADGVGEAKVATAVSALQAAIDEADALGLPEAAAADKVDKSAGMLDALNSRAHSGGGGGYAGYPEASAGGSVGVDDGGVSAGGVELYNPAELHVYAVQNSNTAFMGTELFPRRALQRSTAAADSPRLAEQREALAHAHVVLPAARSRLLQIRAGRPGASEPLGFFAATGAGGHAALELLLWRMEVQDLHALRPVCRAWRAAASAVLLNPQYQAASLTLAELLVASASDEALLLRLGVRPHEAVTPLPRRPRWQSPAEEEQEWASWVERQQQLLRVADPDALRVDERLQWLCTQCTPLDWRESLRPLHLALALGASVRVAEALLDADPDAAHRRAGRYGDTPIRLALCPQISQPARSPWGSVSCEGFAMRLLQLPLGCSSSCREGCVTIQRCDNVAHPMLPISVAASAEQLAMRLFTLMVGAVRASAPAVVAELLRRHPSAYISRGLRRADDIFALDMALAAQAAAPRPSAALDQIAAMLTAADMPITPARGAARDHDGSWQRLCTSATAGGALKILLRAASCGGYGFGAHIAKLSAMADLRTLEPVTRLRRTSGAAFAHAANRPSTFGSCASESRRVLELFAQARQSVQSVAQRTRQKRSGSSPKSKTAKRRRR